jgi:hypothetical protein
MTLTVRMSGERIIDIGPVVESDVKSLLNLHNVKRSDWRIFYLNQPIKWADFRLDALLADKMLTKLYTTGP